MLVRSIAAVSVLAAVLFGADGARADLLPDHRIGGVILRDGNRLYAVGGVNVDGVQQITRIDLDAAGRPTSSKWCGAIVSGSAGYVSAAISGRWLFVTGGGLKGVTVRFEIRPDGSLANRTELPNGDRPECNMSGLVATGPYLVIAGGWQTRAVFAARIGADGSLGPWIRQRPLPCNCFTQGRIFRIGRRLFAAGNPGWRKESDRFFSSEVAADGAVTKWRRWGELPETTDDFDFQPMPDGRSLYYRSGETGAQYVATLAHDDDVVVWRKLESVFPDGPYVTQTGIPLACGSYLRYAGYRDDPQRFLKAALVPMRKEKNR